MNLTKMPFTFLVVMMLSTTSLSLYANVNAQTNTTETIEETHVEGETHAEEEAVHADESQAEGKTITRDSLAITLQGTIIPGAGFLHLYDSTPYSISSGHVAANLPCGENSTSTVNILTGVAPNLSPAELENVPQLSTPGELCLYHTDLPPETGGNATVTDIALQNPTEEDVELPAGSTVVIGVNEITPLEEHGHEEGETEAEGATTNSTA